MEFELDYYEFYKDTYYSIAYAVNPRGIELAWVSSDENIVRVDTVGRKILFSQH